ncbi:MAG: DUF4870 domain-containing protein [Puniceicoccales bacterium]|jgi:uncharacterized Tic20 family protein|nr:DUF4870 domain-containing protein [Puniceicoccales bacterium]
MSENLPPSLDPPPKLDPPYYEPESSPDLASSVSNNDNNSSESPFDEIPNDVKSIAMLAHLLSIFVGVLAPLLIWLLKGQTHPFINTHAKEALNFQITIGLAFIVSLLLGLLGTGSMLFVVVLIVNIVLCITGGLRSKDGNTYHYPVALRLVD